MAKTQTAPPPGRFGAPRIPTSVGMKPTPGVNFNPRQPPGRSPYTSMPGDEGTQPSWLPSKPPNIWQRFRQAARYTITGASSAWFGPLDPMLPYAPVDVKGRTLDYPIGYNLQVVPRQEEAVSFGMLRSLSDGYDIIRALIETRKDQVAKMPWEIIDITQQKGDGSFATASTDDRPDVAKFKDFLEYPDNEHSWDTWIRGALEDVLTLDALSIYPRPTKGGQVYSLDLYDGSMIARKLDPMGRTPTPPDVAYQQVLKGVPAVDYTRDELIYVPRNWRAHKVYGYSPLEQIILTVNMGLRREISQLQYFTDGTVPDMIVQTPDSWSPQELVDYQNWWDGLLAGNTAYRRMIRFMPGGAGTGVHEVKEPPLKTEIDEWIVRIACFAFSIPPSAFIRQMNRSTAETAQETALEEGLLPLLHFIEDVMTYIMRKYFLIQGCRFRFNTQKSADPMEQAKIDDINIKNGSKVIDEVRENRGDDPYGWADKPIIVTNAGPVPLKESLDAATSNLAEHGSPTPPPPTPVVAGPNGKAPGKPGAKPAQKKSLSRLARAETRLRYVTESRSSSDG